MSGTKRRNMSYSGIYAPTQGSSAISSLTYGQTRNTEPIRVRQLPKKPPTARRRGQGLSVVMGILVLSLAVVLSMMGFAILIQMTHSAQLQNDIAALQSKVQDAKDINAETQRQLTLAGNGESVRNYAVNKLGMVLPSSGQIRRVSLPDDFSQTAVAPQEHSVPQASLSFLSAMVSLLD